MDNSLIFFSFFSFLALLSGLLVISSTNPVHSVFFLILVFCNTAALLFLLEMDFLALIFLVVYVGAIAVLFLFVVMMLNLSGSIAHENLLQYFPIGTFVGVSFLFHSFLIADDHFSNISNINIPQYTEWVSHLKSVNSIETFGMILYTHYFPYFLIASLILLVAMIGAIVLTIHPTHGVRRQDINDQLIRDFQTTIVLR